jgi:hypothetical protein
MKRRRAVCAIRGVSIGALLLVLAGTSRPVMAQSIILDSDEERIFQDFTWLPYAFYSGSFGLGFGAGGAYSGWHEEQTSLLGALTLGTKGSYNVMGAASDLRVPGFQRLYFQPLFMFGRYQDQFLYIGLNNAGFEGERAGANDSDQENYVAVIQNDARIDLAFRYLLPIGHGADDDGIVHRYVLKEGFLSSAPTGGESWNPLTSGRSYLYLTPQWREQTLEQEGLELPLETRNVEVVLERDNREFPYNATRGSYQRVAYKKDFYEDEILDSWDLWTFSYSKLFSLRPNRAFKQRVLAFDWWTAYVPSWETETVNGETSISGRPPQYDGATLGGLHRMRAYEDSRFHDKAANFYSVEYRFIPHWQPHRHIELLDWADIQYIQWVLFAETGQVSPHWNVSDLHSDLHYDGGIGLRGMIHKAVCRLDFAFGEEGMRMVAMYGHPF